MCNLYSMRISRDELVRLFGITRVGNDVHFDLPDIYPDQMAPVIKQESSGLRVLTTMRWGFPPPPNLGTRPVTNVRNTRSSYWRNWLLLDLCNVEQIAICQPQALLSNRLALLPR